MKSLIKMAGNWRHLSAAVVFQQVFHFFVVNDVYCASVYVFDFHRIFRINKRLFFVIMYVWNRLVAKRSTAASVRRSDPLPPQRCHSEYLNSEELEKLKPKLLSGEVIVSRASKIVGGDLCGCLEEDRVGELIVTNFRIIFCPYLEKEGENHGRIVPVTQRNKLIGNNDIALYNVDAVYSVKKKKRKLIENGIIPRRLKVIEIKCKDFRVHFFHLKLLNEKNEASLLLSAILNGAFPPQLSSLFAFHYDIEFERDDVPRFNSEQDWKELLERKGALGAFRVVQCNKDFRESDSLPEYFAVASSLTESDIIRSIKMFSNNRCPVWSYTHSNGASIVRMASSIPGVGEEAEIKMTEHVQRSNGRGGGAGGGDDAECLVIDLSRRLPSLLEIQQSYESLQSLCMPGSLKDFWLSDAVWFSSLESSRWLSSVSRCLELANEAADNIVIGRTVVLKEVDGVDFVPLVSCLIQLIVDADVRTIDGFERLVDREWVALGHKFAERYGSCQRQKTDIKSSVFLLFLDCVWQIVRQFPSEIQFTEYFLVSIWDSVCIGVFRNFLFDDVRSSRSVPPKTPSRDQYVTRLRPPALLSVWEWEKQFCEDQVALFFNPLYVFLHDDALSGHLINNISVNDSGLSSVFDSKSSKTKDALLKPNAQIPRLQFWSLCYLRWLPAAEVMGGGPACEYLSQCILVEEILYLCQMIEMESADAKRCPSRRSSRLIFGSNGNGGTIAPRSSSVSVSSSFPFGRPTNARFGPSSFIDSYFKSSVLYRGDDGSPTSNALDD